MLNLITQLTRVIASALEELPPSRERSLALTKLEESEMWAVRAGEVEPTMDTAPEPGMKMAGIDAGRGHDPGHTHEVFVR